MPSRNQRPALPAQRGRARAPIDQLMERREDLVALYDRCMHRLARDR